MDKKTRDKLIELRDYANNGAKYLGDYKAQGLAQNFLHNISISLNQLLGITNDNDPIGTPKGQLDLFQTQDDVGGSERTKQEA